MKNLLIASAVALGLALSGVPAMAASSTSTDGSFQVAQAGKDAPAKKGKKKSGGAKKSGGKKGKKKAS